jgi:anti-sigma factor RsiW
MTIQLDILESTATEGHPDEGTLQAWLDGELALPEAGTVETHVAECPPCAARIKVLQGLASRSRALLEGVGEEAYPVDRMALDAARWSVRRRRAAGKGRGMGRRSAAAAAGLVLLATGVAAAIPGSPLRSLFTEAGSSGSADTSLATASAPAMSDLAGMAGVAVGLRDARVEVVLEGAAPGTPVELEVGTGERVEVLAPDGTPFRAGTGSVTVQLRGVAGERVVVRIPPGPGEVLVRAGLRNLARWNAGAFHFGEGIVAEPRSDGVRVEVPEP